jgi:hypothetical protein
MVILNSYILGNNCQLLGELEKASPAHHAVSTTTTMAPAISHSAEPHADRASAHQAG